MRLFTLLFLIAASTDAKRRRTDRRNPQIKERPLISGREFLNTHMRKIDDDENRGLIPVPFGHIFREGIEDPESDFKQPMDLLELHTIYLKDGPYARDLIKTHKKKFQVITYENDQPRIRGIVPPPAQTLPPVYHDPTPPTNREPDPFDQQDSADDLPSPLPDDQTSLIRDNLPSLASDDQAPPQIREGDPFSRSKYTGSRDNDTIVPFWNLEAILKRNIEEPPKYRLGGGRRPNNYAREPVQLPSDYAGKAGMFAKNTYGIFEEIKEKVNSTSCDEFGKNAKFHPDDIVNIDWVPFYVWTNDEQGKVTVAYVHHFSYPTKKLVNQYREKFGPYLNHSVDWDQPKLYFKSYMVQALLIAIDRTGLFHGIPFHRLPANPASRTSITIPIMKLRLKIVDPYLSMMFCSLDYANIMSVSRTEPREYDKCVKEAAILKFRGPGLPVRRDFAAEANEKRKEMIEKARRNEMKFISAADQWAASGLK